jgi:hypothetical protein
MQSHHHTISFITRRNKAAVKTISMAIASALIGLRDQSGKSSVIHPLEANLHTLTSSSLDSSATLSFPVLSTSKMPAVAPLLIRKLQEAPLINRS